MNPRVGIARGSINRSGDGKRRHGRFRVWLAVFAAGAVVFCSAANASGIDNPVLRSRLAETRALDDAGRFEQAIRRYRELLRQYPDSAEARLGLANDLARTANCADSPAPETSAASVSSVAQEAVRGICYFRRHDMPAAIERLS